MAEEKSYRVYVLRNRADRFYIGLSENTSKRLSDHNRGVSQWTKRRGPWTLDWKSEPMSLTEARRLENKLKGAKGGTQFYALTGLTRNVSGS